ncbi:5-oxoprolinase subunit PxpB [Vibrio viridaestus]|uniref:5-oxoprolinase subunit PxpB n=1 Tax=Vibrio viridaestus TaxID=2487322 RepID=A0A3N9TYM6_9VIBR|nr:5-oxoprolinase subunit PxpB [Vibrio viridaestus]RQW62032.1 5-oxoprolinase subunit PxpB [Vibrio viridaestus]
MVSTEEIRLYQLGESVITLEYSKEIDLSIQRKIWKLAEVYQSHAHVTDIVPGMNNLTVIFELYSVNLVEEQQRLSDAWFALKNTSYAESRMIEIPVHYGGDKGPDLDNVANHCGMSAQKVVDTHSQSEYVVYFLGFQPGFAYLGGMPESIATPRHSSPRAKVPKGSVAIGGAQTGVYPNVSPGGWQIIGHTDIELFVPNRKQPSIWLPGDSVRFTVAGVSL